MKRFMLTSLLFIVMAGLVGLISCSDDQDRTEPTVPPLSAVTFEDMVVFFSISGNGLSLNADNSELTVGSSVRTPFTATVSVTTTSIDNMPVAEPLANKRVIVRIGSPWHYNSPDYGQVTEGSNPAWEDTFWDVGLGGTASRTLRFYSLPGTDGEDLPIELIVQDVEECVLGATICYSCRYVVRHTVLVREASMVTQR